MSQKFRSEEVGNHDNPSPNSTGDLLLENIARILKYNVTGVRIVHVFIAMLHPCSEKTNLTPSRLR
jgi:hypothetical protein